MFDTKLLSPTPENISYCARLIKCGEIVGMPTETVYGLAANAFDESAVRKIFAAKGRPADNPLIVHISDIDMIKTLSTDIPELAWKLAESFWPGPLTMVLPKTNKIPTVTSGGLDTVGIRMPKSPVARELIRACMLPLAAPSANISGRPSTTSALHVLNDLNGLIPAVLDGGECEVGVESTVISFESDGVRILRPGIITADELMSVAHNVFIDNGVLNEVSSDIKAASPGMKYKHYSPKAKVVLVDGSLESFIEYAKENASEDTFLMCFDGDEIPDDFNAVYYGKNSREQANRLFKVLRELDELNAKTVFARVPEKSGEGLAVYNRILRAAAFEIVRVGE